jgi:prepilin-type N-terminal cleavage/methylation domain-containing protein
MPRNRRAFTLIELLVVIAIIAILAAILFPVFAKARERAKTSQCISNMKQIGTAVMMYTDDYDGVYPKNRNYQGAGMAYWTWKRAIFPFVKSYEAFKCPSVTAYWSDTSTVAGALGDESNVRPEFRNDKSQWMPCSYAYSGGFFHETSGGGDKPRAISQCKEPADTIFILNSRLAYPDLGPWTMEWRVNPKTGTLLSTTGSTAGTGYGPFVVHDSGRLVFIMADGHVQSMKLAQTVYPKDMWKHRDYSLATNQSIYSRCAKEYR